jgi:hypothetical protein
VFSQHAELVGIQACLCPVPQSPSPNHHQPNSQPHVLFPEFISTPVETSQTSERRSLFLSHTNQPTFLKEKRTKYMFQIAIAPLLKKKNKTAHWSHCGCLHQN